ncbi:hypothetical protein ACFX2I_006811 [Malus domestica]
MYAQSRLPMFLWGEALKTANYIINRVPSKSVTIVPFKAWTGREPSFNHFHIWGCKAEARFNNPNEKKLDSRTTSCRFIGYSEKSKEFKFYLPHGQSRIMETHNAKFIEESKELSSSATNSQPFEFEEMSNNSSSLHDQQEATMQIPTVTFLPTVIAPLEMNTDAPTTNAFAQEPASNDVTENSALNEEINVQSQDIPTEENEVPTEVLAAGNVRRSQRTRKINVLPDFVYLNEAEFSLGDEDDLATYHQAITSMRASLWHQAMEEEIDSMLKNKVWSLVPKPAGVTKTVGCKWVFKTKRNSQGNIDKHKARLVGKGFTEREGIDYNETFSPVSTKDSMRVILALTAHFDLELHQMDVKTAFLNGDLEEDIYMHQPPGFVERGKESMIHKLNKSIYGLKQASRQWNKKFDHVMSSFGFRENKMDECVYLKISGSKVVFLVLYVDDILIASSDLTLLQSTKEMLANSFDMKDLGEAKFALGIEIIRDRSKKALGLSQRLYADRITKRFNMENCSSGELPIGNGDKFSNDQSPKNDLEKDSMKTKPYASLVGSLMYAQVCTRPDLAFAVSVLGRF